MKKTWTLMSLLLFSGLFSAMTFAGGPEIKAYYFHATRRCATCQAVEKVSKETIEENFSKEVEFVSLNREQAENKKLVDKYEVSGQTLLLVKGDEVIDLTSTAFMYARTKPEKLEEKLGSAIKSLL